MTSEHRIKFDLVAIDLDGTLLGSDNKISPRVEESLALVQAKGIKVTIATGRMFISARTFAKQLGIDVPLICYQGAQIRDPITGNIVTEALIPQEIALLVINYCKKYSYHVNAFQGDMVYMDALTKEAEFYLRLSGVDGTVVNDLTNWLAADLLKLVIVTDESTTFKIVKELTEELGDQLNVTRSYPIFAETISPIASKGRALRKLAAHLGIQIERTMGIGDNLNDLDLVEVAGFGVAMGNGAPEVKAQADYVTDNVESDGVATALDKLILQR